MCSRNNLLSSIPADIGTLSKLGILDLHSNQVLPIFSMAKLSILYYHHFPRPLHISPAPFKQKRRHCTEKLLVPWLGISSIYLELQAANSGAIDAWAFSYIIIYLSCYNFTPNRLTSLTLSTVLVGFFLWWWWWGWGRISFEILLVRTHT